MATGFNFYTHDAGVKHANTLTLKSNASGTQTVTLMTKADALIDAPQNPVDGNITVEDNLLLGGRTIVSEGANGGAEAKREEIDCVAGNIVQGATILGVTGTATTGTDTFSPVITVAPPSASKDGPAVIKATALNASPVEKTLTNCTADNIKKGVTIGGVAGKYEPTTTLQSKTVTYTENTSTSGDTIRCDSNYDGLQSVKVVVNVPSSGNVQANKDFNITSNGTHTITADNAGYSMGKVTAYVNVQNNLQAKTVVPTATGSVVVPDTDDGYNGLSSVVVLGATKIVDSNIKEENIKSGISILGVTGTYDGGGAPFVKWCETQTFKPDADFTGPHTFNFTSHGELPDFVFVLVKDRPVPSVRGEFGGGIYFINGMRQYTVGYTDWQGVSYYRPDTDEWRIAARGSATTVHGVSDATVSSVTVTPYLWGGVKCIWLSSNTYSVVIGKYQFP